MKQAYKDNYDLIDWSNPIKRGPVTYYHTPKRSDLPAPMLALDTMDPVVSQLDGKTYDSKAALRTTYKQAGMVEVGNDSSMSAPKPRPKLKADRQSAKDTVDKAFSQAGFGA